MVRGKVIFSFLIVIATVYFLAPATTAQKPPHVTIDVTPGDNVIVDANGDFHVPLRTRLYWTVDVTIANPADNPDTFQNMVWFNNYDAALEIVSAVATHGNVAYTTPSPPTQIHWQVGSLAPGATAHLRFVLATRVNRGGQQLYASAGCEPWESGAVLHYRVVGQPGNRSMEFAARQRCVEEDPPWVSFSITSRKDWRLRGPGCFVSEAARIEIASNDRVSIMFEEFGDLTYLESPSSPPIPTSYAWGDDLRQIGPREFLRAGAFNGTVWTFGPSSALEAGITETLWSQVCIGPEHRSSEYEDEGIVTITLHGASTYIDKP